MHASLLRTVGLSAVVLSGVAFASTSERAPLVQKEAKPAKTEAAQKKVRVFDTLQGKTETTRLPDTARREDARGGFLI